MVLQLATAALLFLPQEEARADMSPSDVGMTNQVVANATTSSDMGNPVLVENVNEVGVMFNYHGDRAGTGNLVVKVLRSDGNTWETTPGILVTNALNGNTAVSAYFVLTPAQLAGAKWIKFPQVQNYDGTVNATNCSLVVGKKLLKAGL